MPPFSPVTGAGEEIKGYMMFDNVMNVNMNVNMSMNAPQHLGDGDNKMSNDSQDITYKPLVFEILSSPSSASTVTASTSATSLSSHHSEASAMTFASHQNHHHQNNSNKIKRSVSFREDISDVHTVEGFNHPQDIQNQWYSKRELYIIKHKIRSLLRWYNMRDAHYFQYEQQEQVEYYDDDSQERYLRNVPPPPQPPCVTFYEESLFGLEKHLSRERSQVRETKYNSQTAVFCEQELQKQMGHYDQDRLAQSYAQTAAASQQEALVIAQINAQESELHRQELEAQQLLDQEKQIHLDQLEEKREREQRRIESLETSLLSQQDCDLEHLFVGEGGRPPKNPFDIFTNWKACFGKLFQAAHDRDCEIDSDEDCLNAPPRQPKRHACLFVSDIQEEGEEEEQEEEYYYR
mmetsp:Transcript_16047/g.39299  ORF Transcript_16047/g.39299 Transcript_16047/m.39299 type:complete len:406 (-) Transcript_16047:175-1392(-)|eukprot:CAMPEP_0113622282 /NCGR_PEP_ID=MMETSP0017_2-20120614/11410_1 /TAXON_ID=2856 /ORGANISM="Cylindrotheca closterium" /LENGTH=405 /DNA_ID=CAMNT_0000532093 /DNA_START=261 /DNA_END=1478 /DNA_ORIENTATION=+ /assembly_acc=CAM_ASM_000147